MCVNDVYSDLSKPNFRCKIPPVIFIETPLFTNLAIKYNLDESLGDLEKELIINPLKGDLIRESGGLRKIRLAKSGGGKSGGYRVIYYLATPEAIFLLLVYPKSKKDNLTKTEVKTLRQLIEGRS